MKVLVTGGAGFIGSHVAEYLIQYGHETVIVDNFQTGKKNFVPLQAKLIEMDINSPMLETVIALEKPEIVIHLAAQIDVAVSIKDPIYDAEQNIVATIRLLDYCQKYHVKKVIFSSSCAVYGETEDSSITESFPVNPLSFYGLSKATSEKYIQLTSTLQQLPYTILRYANVYGPRQSIIGEGGVVSVFFGKMLNGETPVIFGDGEQTRDFVYVKDVAQANLLAINKGDNEIINIGTDTKTSVNELLSKIMSISSVQIAPITMPAREGDIQHSRLDNTKAFTVLGWKPSFDIQTGLEETFSYYKVISEYQKGVD
ncbi:NAD-dependent epimerase/dehydratase family protein [Sporosarcina highlanderae]|uniref:NAD-dependent epimerase/dehydratase family protein n=1 Tax=Sporosarcina highlanderae TaxID=3035916 RepID=A0ABT8JV04_9BACL|nr:NAD-dependent epimerase/dehydratase family protein [Sporosarcina highlanderae]MDN4609011.1 NAD-dependent epimerase/dehydratase family protein [Sporosarcina highlanderae]